MLRELPSLRSGDLPARRAIPSAAFALHKSCGDVYLFEGLFAVLYSFAVEGFLLLIFACWCLLVQAVNAPAAFARGLLAFEGFILAARECDFWQQIHYLPFLGRLRGGRRGGLLGAAAPPRPPLHSPRTTPLGLVASLHSHGLAFKGLPYSAIPRGLRGFRSGSFLAALGDLPPRRAMPVCAFALHERAESFGLAARSLKNNGYCWGNVRWGSHSCGFIENKAGLVL